MSKKAKTSKQVELEARLLSDDSGHDVNIRMGVGVSGEAMIRYSSVVESHEKDKWRGEYKCEFSCTLQQQSDEEKEKTKKAGKQLLYASVFCLIFMIAEIVGGIIANSLALLSDATHLLSDFVGLGISMAALWLVSQEAKGKYSFGYHRAEIIGALFSVFLIWGLTVWLVIAAIQRLVKPQAVEGRTMFIVACLGILVNIIMGAILHQSGGHSHGLGGGHSHDHGHSHSHGHGAEASHSKCAEDGEEEEDEEKGDTRNINVRSAFVHVLGDLVQSLGVVVAAAFIWADHDTFRFLDPVCTLVFSIIVMFTTFSLVRDALDVLMENVPKHLDTGRIKAALAAVPDVGDVHDLHVWNLSVGKVALSAHLLVKSSTKDNHGKIIPACVDGILRNAQQLCASEFGIKHSTIQIEWPRDAHMSHLELQKVAHPEYCSPPPPEEVVDTEELGIGYSHPHIDAESERGAHSHGHGHNHSHGHSHANGDDERKKDT